MNQPVNVLLLEDDPALHQLILEEFEAEGYCVTGCHTVSQAKTSLQQHTFELIVTDLRLPDGSGMELLEPSASKQHDLASPAAIVITAFGSVRQAVKALQAGADDFLTKPLDLEHLLLSTRRVLSNRTMRNELQHFRTLSTDHGFHGLYGKSPVMQKLYAQIQVIAKAQGPILIHGESGTGKELIARALHAESQRFDKPFLAVNCAGIPAELLESEFFGHASGSFTGAKTGRKGLLQEADGGTLLLDEIGEMPLLLQAKLLRALQDGWIRPVGHDTEIQVDVRILAATHQDLRKAVEEGRFREDLYYRLETFGIHVPPVRDREDDIDLLALRFLLLSATAQQKRVNGFTPEALKLLRRYAFPGNVREMQNVVERAVVFCSTDIIGANDLPERVQTGSASSTPSIQDSTLQRHEAALLDGQVWPTLDEMQKRYIQLILKEVEGNKRRAAALLGIGRRTLYRWLGEEE